MRELGKERPICVEGGDGRWAVKCPTTFSEVTNTTRKKGEEQRERQKVE